MKMQMLRDRLCGCPAASKGGICNSNRSWKYRGERNMSLRDSQSLTSTTYCRWTNHTAANLLPWAVVLSNSRMLSQYRHQTTRRALLPSFSTPTAPRPNHRNNSCVIWTIHQLTALHCTPRTNLDHTKSNSINSIQPSFHASCPKKSTTKSPQPSCTPTNTNQSQPAPEKKKKNTNKPPPLNKIHYQLHLKTVFRRRYTWSPHKAHYL